MRSPNGNNTGISVKAGVTVTAFLFLGLVLFVSTGGRQNLGSKVELQASNEALTDARHMTCMNQLGRKWRGMDESSWQEAHEHIPFSSHAVFGFSDDKTGELRQVSLARAGVHRGLKTMNVLKQHHSDMSDVKESGVVKFLYSDNTVVVADLNMCKVTGIYEATPQGMMDPRVSRDLPARQSRKWREDIAFGKKTGSAMAFTVRVGHVGSNGNPGSGFCSGVIMSPTMVLTAKHCLDKVTSETSLEIVAGAAKISDSTNRQIRVSAEFIKHRTSDIALVRVSSAFTLNYYVEKVELVMGYKEADWSVDAAGYGHNEHTSGMSPDRKEGAMKTKTDSFCQQHDARFKTGDELCCVGGETNGDGNTCGGDSGGPLLYTVSNRKSLLGVNSWSRTDCWRSGNVDIFVNIADADHVSWLVAWVGHYSGHTPPVVYKTNCKQTQWTAASSGSVFIKGSEVVVDCESAK